jgi:hypothetical protein
MATERQIESNRHNSMLSTGPSSPEGKARSRFNALKHGLAAELPTLEVGLSPKFLDRRASWSAEFQPESEAAEWALDRAVAASFRIEECESTYNGIVGTARERARLSWDQDQAIMAATIAGRLARDPVLASRQLEATRAGVVLLMELWLRLLEAIVAGAWLESDESNALDLLGVPADMRSGLTPIDDPEGSDLRAFREALVLDEMERLKALRENVMDELDEIERSHAMRGDAAMFSKPAKLILRYERDAWKRYRDSIKEIKDQALATTDAPPIPLDSIVRPSTAKPAEKRHAILADLEPPIPADLERRELVAEGKAYLASIGRPIDETKFGGDDEACLKELERRFDELSREPVSARPLATERSRIDGAALAPAQGGA